MLVILVGTLEKVITNSAINNGMGYIKYDSGLLIVYGVLSLSGSQYKQLTFPVSFASANYIIVCSHLNLPGMEFVYDTNTTAQVGTAANGFIASNSKYAIVGWVAIGLWK